MTPIDPVLFAKALADETRQEIMKRLCCCWLNVNDLVAQMEGRVNQPTVSHHLKKLEEAGFVAGQTFTIDGGRMVKLSLP